jgi:hypothetical protein
LVVLDVTLYLDGVELPAGDGEVGVDVVVVLLEEFVGDGRGFAEEEGEFYAGCLTVSVN